MPSNFAPGTRRLLQRGQVARALVVIGFACAFHPAFGQAQADPMRPARQWLEQQPQSGADPQGEAVPAGGQVVVTGPSRRFAMVGSHAVHVGETYNGAKLLAIREDELVWQRPEGTEHTSMTPGIRKKPSKPEPEPARPARRKEKTIGDQ
jgi:hypothetical protein